MCVQVGLRKVGNHIVAPRLVLPVRPWLLLQSRLCEGETSTTLALSGELEKELAIRAFTAAPPCFKALMAQGSLPIVVG